MAGDPDSLYKRQEDKDWRDRVNDRLATLTSGETVQNDKLDALNEKLNDVHKVLEGDAEDREDTGIKGDIKELSAKVARINTLLGLDITGDPGSDVFGKPGYLKKIDILWKGEERADRRADRIWKGLVPIIVAAITSGFLVYNLQRIERFFRGEDPKAYTERIHRDIEQLKKTRGPEIEKMLKEIEKSARVRG